MKYIGDRLILAVTSVDTVLFKHTHEDALLKNLCLRIRLSQDFICAYGNGILEYHSDS